MSFQTFYVATNGNDRWSGTLDAPNAEGSDGPFASVIRARDHVRQLKRSGDLTGPVTVQIRGGRYSLLTPLLFTPEDSAPVTYAAYPGEQPILSGGTPITGWQVEQREGKTVWTTIVPEVAAGKHYFRQLFVNGQRRARSRWPKVNRHAHSGEYFTIPNVPEPAYTVPYGRIADYQIGSYQFYTHPGDMQNFQNLQDVEIVALHRWIEERMPVESFDAEKNLVTSQRLSMFRLALPEGQETPASESARYYIENVFEALSDPGEWYLERATGRLHYIPMPGETPENTEVFTARLTQLLKIEGQADSPVSNLRFQGLTFEHGEWTLPKGGWWPETYDRADVSIPDVDFAASPQAAVAVPGTIYLKHAHHCSLDHCTVQHVGWYGIELTDGCVGNRITHSTITDVGAGGIRVGGGDHRTPPAHHTAYNHITDNHIADGGIIFHSGIGVFLQHAFGCVVAHNHIHDFYYSGISCGWVWGFAENISRDNIIEYNHIHDLGFYWLDDMGGIYMLGVQPGTVVRNNLVHDVYAIVYGGWTIYTDEGSSHIIVENNIGYNTSHQAFHQHYGRENIIRNNIWAFGGESQLAVSRVESFYAGTFERNIIVTRDQPVWVGGYGNDFSLRRMISDLNLFWSATGSPIVIGAGARKAHTAISFEDWQARGYDRHSVIADPQFKDLSAFDFTLSANSPALALGFAPIDITTVGPRQG